MSIKIAQVLYGKHTIKISNIMIDLSFYLNRVTDDKILNTSIGIFCSWRIGSGWLNLVCVCQLVGFIQFTYQLFYGKTPKSKCNLWFYDLLKPNFTVYFSTDLEKWDRDYAGITSILCVLSKICKVEIYTQFQITSLCWLQNVWLMSLL